MRTIDEGVRAFRMIAEFRRTPEATVAVLRVLYEAYGKDAVDREINRQENANHCQGTGQETP